MPTASRDVPHRRNVSSATGYRPLVIGLGGSQWPKRLFFSQHFLKSSNAFACREIRFNVGGILTPL
jgi:hypothetical protein